MSKIASKTLPPKPMNADAPKDTSNKVKLGIAAKINSAVRLGGLLTDTHLIYRNHFLPQMRVKFPMQPFLWHVEKMYPMKNGKQLLVDHPEKQWEKEECEKKKKIYKEAGLVYLAVPPEKSLQEFVMEAGTLEELS